MKSFKQIISLLIVVSVLLGMCVVPAFAISTVTISVEKAVPGYPVTVLADGAAITDETVTWYVSGTEDGAYTLVEGATGDGWQITNACANKWIKAEVGGIRSNAIKVGGGLTGEGQTKVSNVATEKQSQYAFRLSGSTENASAYYQVLDSETVDSKKQYLILRAGQSTASGNVGKTGTVKWEPDADPSTNKTMAYWLEHYWYEGVSIPDAWKGTPTNGQPPINATNNATLDSSIKPYVVEHTWLTANNNKTVLNDYTFKAHATVMSSTEFRKYANKLYINTKVMLRNGRKDNSNAFQYYNCDTKYFNAMSPQARTYYVFPIFYVTEDLFKNVKFDLTATGADVKALITEHNDYESLINIGYSETEIEELGVIREEPEIPVEPSVITISVEKAVPGYPVEVKVDSAAVTTQTVTWYVSNEEDGEYTLIDGATGDGWQITNACANNYIKAEVDGIKSNAILVGAGMSITSSKITIAAEKKSDYSFRLADSAEDAALYYQLLDIETVGGKKQYYVIQLGKSAANGNVGTTGTTKWEPDADPETRKTMAYWLEHYWYEGISTPDAWKGSTAASQPINGIFDATLEASLKPYVPEHTWLTERNDNAIKNDYTFKAHVAVLSSFEFAKYADRLYDVDKNMMRNGVANNAKYFAYYNAETGYFNSIGATARTYTIRPTFYLTEDFFKNVKLDLSATGDDVKDLILEHNNNDAETLKAIGYTDEELIELGVIKTEFVSLKNDAGIELKKGEITETSKLTATYTIVSESESPITRIGVIAVYDDTGALEAFKVGTITVESGAKNYDVLLEGLELDSTKKYTAKVMLWETVENLTPVIVAEEF